MRKVEGKIIRCTVRRQKNERCRKQSGKRKRMRRRSQKSQRGK